MAKVIQDGVSLEKQWERQEVVGVVEGEDDQQLVPSETLEALVLGHGLQEHGNFQDLLEYAGI